MRFALAILALSGCKGLLGIEEARVGDAGDAGIDAPDDTMPIDAFSCFGMDPYVVCPGNSTGAGPIPALIDTSDEGTCDFLDTSNGRDWCVLVRDDFPITASHAAIGARPLVLLARGALTISTSGKISVASHAGNDTAGAGGSTIDCNAGAGIMGGEVGQGSGGAGGTFKGFGGDGGAGHGEMVPGGVVSALISGTALRGGCAGGRGGGVGMPPGGRGGGAIYLLAADRLTIEGSVNASGAGGSPGLAPGSGGGGGGSGGMIVLSAPMVNVAASAMVFANGGGGGSGGYNGGNGGPGADPASPTVGALGSTLGTGGAGGRGAFGSTAADDGMDDGAGGGGGGGGAGYVRVQGTASFAGGTVSPPPS